MHHGNQIDRRAALGSLAAAGLGVGLGTTATTARAGADAQGSSRGIASDALGWDAAKGEYVLPDLPYGYNALEPIIDEETMRIHHGKHHAGYVRGLNGALRALQEIRDGQGDQATIEHWLRKLSFHAGGHINHALFWSGMAPAGSGGGGAPFGALAEAITRDFGSFEKFSAFFRESAKKVEGSGWAWLVREPMSGRLLVLQMHNQQHSVFGGADPLLGIDVWEHAYYLRYQNRRAEYVDAFMDVVNWGEIARRFAAAGG